MSRLARHRQEELKSRIIIAILVLGIMIFLGFFSWRLWMGSHGTRRFTPHELELPEKPDRKRVDTSCYEFYLPLDFEVIENADCQLNAYARTRKYSYLQVSPYYDIADETAMIERWRSRWLTLGAVERSRDRVIIDGHTAWRMEDYYPQNRESFVSYLILLDKPIRVDGGDIIAAFELRFWATSDLDREFTTDTISGWQWRF